MNNPLGSFKWNNLYSLYDNKCNSFNSNHHLLKHYNPLPKTDRELYYQLVNDFSKEKKRNEISFETYGAMLYWKLYSSRNFLLNDSKILPKSFDISKKLKDLGNILPKEDEIKDNIDLIKSLLKSKEIRIYGMENGLPVKTTFLHFIYPEIIPIFDKMVLQAINGNGYNYKKGDNQKIDVFEKYISFNWQMAEKYKKFKNDYFEPMVRLIDMALWIIRDDII